MVTWLVESKAKLTPLDWKGDAVKAEVCGAVITTRLKGHMLKHGQLDMAKWYSSGSEGPVVTDGVSGAAESSGNGMKSTLAETKETKALWGAMLIDQVDPTRYSSLAKLCGVAGYVRRAVNKWLACTGRASIPAKWEAVLTVRELETAFQDLCNNNGQTRCHQG